ncbi:PLDc N-terminal domain-containing protein [Ectothiorhodospiraceae bacterium 2226]|nr:PLDc N-terminal domain-containing protein [Ectothiorhodospiraceae bacterium 2226]
MNALLNTLAPHLLAWGTLAITLWASAHAILKKEDTRAAVGWVGVIWLAPIVGAVLYALLGVNRIKRAAANLRNERAAAAGEFRAEGCASPDPKDCLPSAAAHLASMERLVRSITDQPLRTGNRLTPLVNGDAAYPRMLEAIAHAQHSITLSTYLFDYDAAGRRFIAALAEARRRGVEVRVLIDAVGARYSFPRTAVGPLRRAGVRVARFLPTLGPWRTKYMNLRSHRKILVVDGRCGFTGGMNIRHNHMLETAPRHPVQDLHFEVEGPVVGDLQAVFAEDWAFTTGERLSGDLWFPALAPAGSVVARGIADGPDEDYDKARLTILGALASAKHRVQIVTPYFLPDLPLIHALHVAALRGVEVDILLPERNNLRVVGWASISVLERVLQRDCRVWMTPPPFDHTKLMIVDGVWMLMGSANWDPRSLALNFEFNVEAYDEALAARLGALVEQKKVGARRLARADLDARPLPIKLRDGVARLLSPYL